MVRFELSWKNENYQNGSVITEIIDAMCFEDVAEDWFRRLAHNNLSEKDCWWKITSIDHSHVCIEMNPGMKCVIRGW